MEKITENFDHFPEDSRRRSAFALKITATSIPFSMYKYTVQVHALYYNVCSGIYACTMLYI